MELIIVIAIISILSAVIIPSLMSYINKAKITKDVSTAKEIEKAIQMALSDPNISQESINYAVNIITLSSTGEISIHSDVRTPDNKFESIYPNKTGKYAKY